jgi:hypothetical protein
MCCIDKRSSAELSEAINSMYSWYQSSSICYVFLDDVPAPLQASLKTIQQAFRESKWWRRGWTLQELLAPSNYEFYDRAWNKLGDKQTLLEFIAGCSGISAVYLSDPFKLESASIATKMSWASRRETTRPEDIAYCLLGLFQVNMALLYGEGNVKAFRRLQLEIIKQSDDESIFAWEDGPERVAASPIVGSGMLARSPNAFENSGTMHPIVLETPIFERKPYSMTNRGLKIRLPGASAEPGYRYFLLHCCAGCEPPSYRYGVPPKTAKDHQWITVKLKRTVDGRWERRRKPRESKLLHGVNPQKFAMDSKAIFVEQEYY